MVDKNINKIISTFKGDGGNLNKCGEMYCTTCGGYMSGIDKRIDNELRVLIRETLKEITLSGLNRFGAWKDVLLIVDESGVVSAYIREANKLNLENIRQMDKFIFSARKVYELKNNEFNKIYQPILDKAIVMALETMDNSLLETLILVLKDEIIKHPNLLDASLEIAENNLKTKKDPKMFRVLYNTLRHIPEVRCRWS